METFLYNTITQKREGPIRQGRYLIDGQPGPLPDGWVELTILNQQTPLYNELTETLESDEYADIPNKLWVKGYIVRSLTEQEISDQKTKPPSSCTPRQFRLALINSDIDIDTIESMLNDIQDPIERKIALIEWEYSIEIKREHPLISTFASQLNISEEQLDSIFILANTFE